MISFKQSDYVRPLPVVQMIALIDVLFINLSFFMALSLHFNFESELSISVPQANAAQEARMAPEEIVINILRDGGVVVNQEKVSLEQLGALLQKTSALYPGQAVIVRADQKTYHEHVVRVLNTCAKSK
ncbi:MAG TPA: biopolymer transporter ExbD, partial [Candidatus Eisenbacteria bacterium]|nr:biopolymer transporter ExbD [Candidatus Eisenbacteria bacterium]